MVIDPLAEALDEYFDLEAALGELNARRERLRDVVLRECSRQKLHRVEHPAGRVRVSVYDSIRARRVDPLLPLLAREGWIDQALQVRGRPLHKLAAARRSVLNEILEHAIERRTMLTIAPKRAP